MTPINYVDPKILYPQAPDLSDVLLLLPSYQGPSIRVRAFIDHLVSLGVGVVASFGVSDVALHRCLVASKARTVLEKESKRDFCLWLDDDMLATPAHVAFLRDAAMIFGAATGIYCKRNNPEEVTIRRQVRERSRQVIQMTSSGETVAYDSHPVLCGMGCLMLHRSDFLAHCAAVPQFVGNKSLPAIPAVCSSGICEDEAGKLGWISEDQCYCQGLWQWVNGVWTTPVAFAHLSSVPLVPRPDSKWLENAESGEALSEHPQTVRSIALSDEQP